jgi:hypothetical protein
VLFLINHYVVIQKEQVVLHVEAAPTESLSNGNLDFPDEQDNFLKLKGANISRRLG